MIGPPFYGTARQNFLPTVSRSNSLGENIEIFAVIDSVVAWKSMLFVLFKQGFSIATTTCYRTYSAPGFACPCKGLTHAIVDIEKIVAARPVD